jgi:hypothetical protein
MAWRLASYRPIIIAIVVDAIRVVAREIVTKILPEKIGPEIRFDFCECRSPDRSLAKGLTAPQPSRPRPARSRDRSSSDHMTDAPSSVCNVTTITDYVMAVPS